MIKKAIYIFLVSAISVSAIGAYSYLPDYLTKKMDRHLKKVFGDELIHREAMLPDSLNINHQLFEISNEDSIVGYSIISRALGCRLGGCDKPSNDSIGFEQFFYMTAFDAQKQVKKVRVLEYTSDHGYQVASKGWLRQFEGKDTFEIGKNIDGISGATISAKSITSGVNQQVKIIHSAY